MSETILPFYIYLMDMAELLMGFYFFTRFIGSRAKLLHFLPASVLCTVCLFLFQGIVSKLAALCILLVLCGVSVYKADMQTSLIWAVIVLAVMQLGHGVFNAITDLLCPIFYLRYPRTVSVLVMTAGIYLTFLLIFLFYHTLLKYFHADVQLKGGLGRLMLAPLLLILFAGQYINHTVYGGTVTAGRPIISPGADLQLLVIQIFSIFSLFSLYFLWQKFSAGTCFPRELTMLNQEIQYQNEFVAEANARYERTAAFRHDVRNHMLVMKGLLDNGNPKQAGEYLNHLEHTALNLSLPCRTNSPVADILIQHKREAARRAGIRFSCSLRLPRHSHVLDTDLCTLLSNALDNALRACEKMDEGTEKFIDVTGKRQGDFFLLEVENSFDGDPSYQEGIGMSNMRTAAEKYHGSLHIHSQGSSFRVSILFVILQHSLHIPQQIS